MTMDDYDPNCPCGGVGNYGHRAPCPESEDATMSDPIGRYIELHAAGWSYAEAEDIMDHEDGYHDDEAVPGCPRCDTLMDDLPHTPASLAVWQAEGHERGQLYVDTGVCTCPRCA